MEIVILAGGRGRRFGAEKQFLAVAPDGSSLLEVTVADAVRAGCRHAVVVTAPGREAEVRKLFATRPQPACAIDVVVQRPDDLPGGAMVARDRPWGTAHALWSARAAVTGPFLLFNADDHYGPNAPFDLAAALPGDPASTCFAMLGFPLGGTLSTAGTVSRALCGTDAAGFLTGLHEVPAIDAAGRIAAGDRAGESLPADVPVSMNAWGFTPAVFPLLEEALREFLTSANLESDECYLPAAIDAGVRSGRIAVRVIPAPDPWCGLTWPADRGHVAARLAGLAASRRAAAGFDLDVSRRSPKAFGNGLVNDTWELDAPGGPRLLQRLNREVFPDPAAVAENAAAAAARVDDALRRRGDADPRHRLVFLAGPDHRPWLRDAAGEVWRCLVRIPAARPVDPTRQAEVRAAARLLGRFPGLVAEGAGPPLREILPGFHDTPARLAALRAAAAADPCGRLSGCRPEHDRLAGMDGLAARLGTLALPIRPVHNDAKLDNVLVDAGSGEALCVIDLDTVMPGLVPHDFGDLVRSAVTGRPEDEPDPRRIVVREEVFGELAAGFLEGSREWLTVAERNALVDGALAITCEQAARFLADHLAGDVYYKVSEAGHNLRRARAQLRLLENLLAVEVRLRRLIAGL